MIETGVYRIDVAADNSAQLRVWKGKARVEDSDDAIKSGRLATFTPNGGTAIAKFDRDDKDALDVWSKERGKDLSKLTANLERASVRTALMRSFLGRRWNMYGSFGLWIYDPFFGGSCFLPFGYGWNSPYGYGFGSYIGLYNLPPVIYYPPPPTSGGNNPPPTTGGNNPPFEGPIDRTPRPPFQKMQQTMGGGAGRREDTRGTSYDPSSGSSSPTYAPPMSAPPMKSDPPPFKSDPSPGPPTVIRPSTGKQP